MKTTGLFNFTVKSVFFAGSITAVFTMAAILFSSCATDKPAGDLDVVSGIDLAAGLSDNEAIVFSLPSPFQMSATLKLLDLDYQESLIEATNKKDQIYTNSNINAMNMGINMIDLAYVLVYEEYSTSLTYLAKLDRMLEELGYGALKDPGLKARIDANCTDRDSLRAIANDVLKKAQVALSETEERKIPVLTVCGLYVEGLYFLMNVYERLIDNRLLTRSLRKNINQLVLQQKVYTHNMVTLLESVGDDELTGMTGQVKQLEQLFTYMDIRYRHDEKQNRITDVSLKTSYLPQLQDVIAQLRNEIVYEELN